MFTMPVDFATPTPQIFVQAALAVMKSAQSLSILSFVERYGYRGI